MLPTCEVLPADIYHRAIVINNVKAEIQLTESGIVNFKASEFENGNVTECEVTVTSGRMTQAELDKIADKNEADKEAANVRTDFEKVLAKLDDINEKVN